MFPPKGSGLEQIRKMLEANYSGFSLQKLAKAPFKQYKMKNPADGRPLNIPAPVQSLQKLQTSVQTIVNDLAHNLTSTITQITKRTPQENYDAVVRGFLPPEARLVKPQYPSNSNNVLVADVDGDKNNELIASYKTNDPALRTLILKKQQDKWTRLAEIINPDTDEIHYRNIADVAGSGRNQLLLGLFTRGNHRTLHCYSVDATGANRLFSKNYHKLELLGLPGSRSSSRAHFAIWNEGGDDTYDIEVMGWDGSQLSSMSIDRYYYRKVLPYYSSKLKQQPGSVSNWYLFADALAKAGAKNDARAIIDAGIKHDKSSEYAERFQNLRNRL